MCDQPAPAIPEAIPETIEILSADEVRRTVNRLASEIVERSGDLANLILVGIYTRGVPLAAWLAQQVGALEGAQVATGAIDITFYRDDLDRTPLRTPARSQIPLDLAGKTVVLVDDVIFSGRTIRAALNALSDYGRPEVVRLLALVDRGHRQLPIHPDYLGKLLPTARDEQVRVYLEAIDGRNAVELRRASKPASPEEL